MARKFRYALAVILVLLIPILAVIVGVWVLNADFYGRLIETKPFVTDFGGQASSPNDPTITLVLHSYLLEENVLECSVILNYERYSMLEKSHNHTVRFLISVEDGNGFEPIGGSHVSSFEDSLGQNVFGWTNSVFNSERFQIPVAPSVIGFPWDDINIRPIVSIRVNDHYSDFNLIVQKRMPGRVLTVDESDRNVLCLTRTGAEKSIVIVSSIVFIIISFILTYVLLRTQKGLSTMEELIAVTGYLLAMAGFRDILGISRDNGAEALEFFVILFPMSLVFLGLMVSIIKGMKKSNDSNSAPSN